MKTSKTLVFLISVGLLWVAAGPTARADERAWRTPLHLSGPTEIPGKVLPAGDYVVKVLNTKEARSIVQFTNSGETEVMATVIAVPDYSIRTAEGIQFVYFQRSEGALPALKSWLYPGSKWGVEFVYPKEKAVMIAETSKQPVYATTSQAEPEKAEIVVLTPEKKEMKVEEYRQQNPKTTETIKTTETVKTTQVVEKPPKRLPKTGSNLPLIGLIGLAALAGAAAVRIIGRPQA